MAAAPGDAADKKGLNKHGLPTGFNYVPKDEELLDVLDVKLSGRPLYPAHAAVFHEVQILDFHPAKLYEMYARDEENGYIYFFSTREFPTSNKRWPLREAEGGTWRSTYGTKAVKSKNSGGLHVGQKQTFVFHQRFPGNKEPVRTNWSMHEFTRVIGPQNEVSDLAVYRLYKIRKNGKETPADLAADAAASMNKRSCTERAQASASMALPPPAPGMADQANVVSASDGAVAAPRPGSSLAPPRAPRPSYSWAPPRVPGSILAPPRAPGPNSWAPPRAPGPSSQTPPTRAARSSRVPPSLPPGSMLAAEERNTQQGSSSSSSVTTASAAELDISPEEFYQLCFGLEEPSGAKMHATTPPPPPEDDNDNDSAAGQGGSQHQGGASSGSHQQDPHAN